jgi:biopolymer transport protein TolQ
VAKATDGFRHYFGRTRSIVDYFFTHGAGKSPILCIYSLATEKLIAEIGSSSGQAPTSAQDTRGKRLTEASFELVKGVAEESLAEQTNRLEDGMNIIGAATTLTPLLGLFGTVLGVLNAFQDMGQQGSVNLATVAPSLSTAMVTTVVGIGVAMPTILGYNFLVGRIEKLKIQFDGFADEYLGRLRREFCEGRTTDGE